MKHGASFYAYAPHSERWNSPGKAVTSNHQATPDHLDFASPAFELPCPVMAADARRDRADIHRPRTLQFVSITALTPHPGTPQRRPQGREERGCADA